MLLDDAYPKSFVRAPCGAAHAGGSSSDTDQWVAVRNARIVLVDGSARAVVASWLEQLGTVCVLESDARAFGAATETLPESHL